MTMALDLLTDGKASARTKIVLAHGAGLPMDSPFMEQFAQGLAAAGFGVIRFEFPYMRARRTEGKRKGPDRPQALMDHWCAVIDEVGPRGRLVIGGKSMGGRIASMIADAAGVKGLVCLGYPFHPPGKPERTRTAHLEALRTPTLIVQGTRDSMGKPDDVAGYSLSKRIEVLWMKAGDHSFKPTKASGRTNEQAIGEAIAAVAAFAKKL
jgi:hypothetical protein